MAKCRSIRCPIHGFVELTESEWAIVNSRPYQRLRDIRQLGMGHMVYPGANHTRFEHCLGALHVSTMIFDHLQRSTDDGMWEECFGNSEKIDRLRKTVRLAALVHDLGHAPFSHAGEDFFIPPDHDLDDISPIDLDNLRSNFNHESMTARLIRETEIRTLVENYGVDVEELIYASTSKELANIDNYRGDLDILNQLLAGELGSDRCDYLIRDAYHSGQPGGQIDLDRIIQQTAIIEHEGALYLGLLQGGWIAAEQMIANRYVAYANLYFHKAKRAYELHLVRFLEGWLSNGRLPQEIDEFLQLSDSPVITAINKAAQERSNHINPDAIAIHDRKHYRVAREFTLADRKRRSGNGFRAIPEEAIKIFSDSVRDMFGSSVFVDILSHSATKIRRNRVNDKILVKLKDGVRYLDEQSEIVSGMNDQIWRLRIHSDSDKLFDVKNFCSQEWSNLQLGGGAA